MSAPADKVLDRIRKLLRLSESSNVHEAALAAARAQELMERHRIDAAMLDEVEDRSAIGAPEDAPLEVLSRLPQWISILVQAVAPSGGCRAFLQRREGAVAAILVGRPADIEAVRVLYQHLRGEIERLTRRMGHGRGRRWCTGFRLGTVTTIAQRLAEARAEVREDLRRSTSDADRLERAIARLDARDAEVEAWMTEHLRLRASPRRVVRADAEAYVQGRMAGHSVALRRHAALATAEEP